MIKQKVMLNLNECKFGDKLKMRNGYMAIYVCREPLWESHFVVCNSVECGYTVLYPNDDGIIENFDQRCYDIIGKWDDWK